MTSLTKVLQIIAYNIISVEPGENIYFTGSSKL